MSHQTHIPYHLAWKNVKFLIRDAAMTLWTSGDFDNWKEMRQLDGGWSEEQAEAFLREHRDEINKARWDIDKWLDGDAEIK